MPNVALPASAAIHQAVAVLHAGNALHPNGDRVFLAFADVPAMDVLAYLGAWGLMARREGTDVTPSAAPVPMRAGG